MMHATFRAPEEPGNYISYFELRSGQASFGQKFWCEIAVVIPVPEAEKDIKMPEIVPKADEPKHLESQPAPPKFEDQLSASMIAKNDYESQAVLKERKDDLMMLYEFGFTDFVVNEYLLQKHGNANIVAGVLMSGQVSEDEIRQIYEKAAQRK